MPEAPSTDQRKKQVVAALNTRYKELNKLWEDAEADLREIPIPIDVKYRYKSEPADPDRPDLYENHYYIAFAKSKGGWRICIDIIHDDGNPEPHFDWTPIAECVVDLRLEAVAHIGALRELVLKAAEECVPTFDKAIADLRSTMESW